VRIEPPRASGPGVQETRQSATVSSKRVPDAESRLRPAPNALSSLELGQEIDAVVIEELADGRLVLDIGGALVEANDPGSLAVGQRLRLQVDFTEPQVLLHIVEQELPLEGEAARLLRQRLPAEDQASLAGLQALLESSGALDEGAAAPVWTEKLRLFLAKLINDNDVMTPERLQQLVRDGGLHYEMKLLRAVADKNANLREIAQGDLKGLLLGALDELHMMAASAEPRRTVAGQLYRLEGQQAANLLAQIEGHAFQLQVPLFTSAGFTDVALSIQGDGGGKSERNKKQSGEYNVLFALELEEFGRMRIDAHVRAESLTAIFYLDVESSLTRLRMELPQLRESLQALGFENMLLSARPLREMAREQEIKFTALSLGVPSDVRLLNVTV
jgi:hypothetical protein